MELLVGRTILEEVSLWGWDLSLYSLTLFPVHGVYFVIVETVQLASFLCCCVFTTIMDSIAKQHKIQ